MKTVLGIFRAACYSPGMVERDEAILRAVAERLERAGYAVSLVHEEEFTADVPMPDVVLHMARSSRVLDILQQWQEAGCRVINSVEGVRSVERATLAELCATEGIPTPRTWIVDTAQRETLTARTTEGEVTPITFPCWVKRTGSCAQEPDDVCRVNDAGEYLQCLSCFRTRKIDKAVVMEHVEGRAYKFYAVKSLPLTPSNWRGDSGIAEGETGFFYVIPGYDKWNMDNSSLAPSLIKDYYKTASPDVYDLMIKNAKELKKNPTDAEVLLWERLRNKQLGKKFRRQHVIGDFIVDFVCLPEKIVIEVDGGYHNDEKQQEADRMRDAILESSGYKVIRFTNEEVLYTTGKVIEKIKSTISRNFLSALSAFPLRLEGVRGRLPVFGGDFIVDPDGVARLIDLNDWPSFSACREEAADAIARLVTQMLP